MKTENWALEAIEREAMNRARMEVHTNLEDELRVYGLSLRRARRLNRLILKSARCHVSDITDAEFDNLCTAISNNIGMTRGASDGLVRVFNVMQDEPDGR